MQGALKTRFRNEADLAGPSARAQGGTARRSRISTSRSTNVHSVVRRSSLSSSLNASPAAGANSNHVKKSKGSPSSREWYRRRATAGSERRSEERRGGKEG